ncbi:MAG: hypothetical protein GY944_11850 [bacterium]|nr:hypothetical protein [Desulfobacteraceae bacterium]MCP5041713.1 hypothetical protein [bacterium]
MKQRYRRPDIQRLLERRSRHGLTFREISEESGIPIPTLSYWAAKVRREAEDDEPASTRFVSVNVIDDERPGRIAIELGSAIRVTVERGFDDEHLTRVLSVLARC